MNILITGGTGSLGRALVERWHGQHRLTLLHRDPFKETAHLKKKGVCFVLADICDYQAVRDACREQEVLIHAAALKDVHQGEAHPREYARVNVEGTRVVADAWADTHRGQSLRRALLVSTDKAVSPLNHYGATKKVAEGIFLERNFSVLRYGNVVESDGAFIHIWKKVRETGGEISVRKPPPTRFYLSMEMAVDLVADALQVMKTAPGVFVPHQLPAFSITEVAEATGLETRRVNLLPGEKQHEILVAEGEGTKKVSLLLSKVSSDWEGKDNDVYSSDKTPARLTGIKVLKLLGWDR